jgi:hypothetical protein
MDLFLVATWLLLAVSFLAALVVSSYYVYVRGAKPSDVFAKLLVALIVYAVLTLGTGFLAGMIAFLGAHGKPPGSILGFKEVLIGSVILVVYAASGWLMCSFIVGALILPSRKVDDD